MGANEWVALLWPIVLKLISAVLAAFGLSLPT